MIPYLNIIGSSFKRILPLPDGGNVLTNLTKTFSKNNIPDQIDNQYQNIINQQIDLQRQMMLVSMYTNIEKTKHDTKMAAVRNLRQ